MAILKLAINWTTYFTFDCIIIESKKQKYELYILNMNIRFIH